MTSDIPVIYTHWTQGEMKMGNRGKKTSEIKVFIAAL